MDVFDKHYHTYRIMLKIIGLWPYNNSVYVWIQRLWISTLFLGNIIFQIVSLLKSEITLRNCTLILSTICPLMIISLRYICFILFFPMIKYLFHHIHMEENIIQDSIEKRIRTKCINDSCYMIEILSRMPYATVAFCIGILVSYLITSDFVMPLNGSRIDIIRYVTLFSVDRTIYFYILCLDFLFVIIFGLLSVICTESIIGFCSYHTSMLFKIISYRIQKIIMYLTIVNLSSKQIEKQLAELYRVVDMHNQAIELLVNAVIMKTNQLEILISFISFVNQLMFMFLCNHNGQILINNSEELFNELYISVWYFVPLKIQKILLLIMIRSSTICMFHILHVFIPCHIGFSKMLSTSFSYFSLIYSIQ
ncbi:uncharacterized protein LOC122717594 [Apis laboriosa]|uniref:uncharacterized protein LOC122717594 n=1 Tax=Apis laboriosa TaxID=183418 RepID=UPI001CC59CB2|nr:uncharacterized protein LOC122717594 [Apis laboriosa]